MKKRLRIIIPLLLIALIAYFVYRHFNSSENNSELRFSGNIEVTETQMSFRIGGRLKERLVEEGDTLKKDQVLARLEKDDQIIAVAQAEANLQYAGAVLAELEAGSRPEDIDRAEAKVLQARYTLNELQNGSRSEEVESARAAENSARAQEKSAIVQLRQAKSDYDRYEKLYKENGVSKTLYENYKTLYETAENKVNEAQARTKSAVEQLTLLQTGPRQEQIHRAEAALKQAEAEYALIKKGPRKETIDQARAKLLLAEENVKLAKQQLSYTELIAPMDGVVLSTSAEAGEYLNPAAPVLTIGRTSKPWLRAYIHEKDLAKVHLGEKVTITTDSYPDKKYPGILTYLSSQAEFTPKTVQTFEERVKLMYRIKVSLENNEGDLKPGMPADGFIDLTAK